MFHREVILAASDLVLQSTKKKDYPLNNVQSLWFTVETSMYTRVRTRVYGVLWDALKQIERKRRKREQERERKREKNVKPAIKSTIVRNTRS